MEIIWNLNNFTSNKPSVITIGTFDGVHLGHQTILERLNRLTGKYDSFSTLITFEPHPQLVLTKSDQPEIRLLTTIEEKIEFLKNFGLDRLIIAKFTPEFAATRPDLFVKNILVKKLNVAHVVIGHDHAFGQGRKGNVRLLEKLGQLHNFTVEVVEPIQAGDLVISSTKIRKHLAKGEVEIAKKLLGRYYSIRGQVIEGDGRGRDLGFPTANIRPYSQYKLIPADGVYAGKTLVENEIYYSVISIGVRPTFNTKAHLIETHLMDFNGTLYNREVDIILTHRLRDEIRFVRSYDLIEQIKKDKSQSMELLEKIES